MYLRMNSNFQDELDQLEAIKANEFGDGENELLQNELAEHMLALGSDQHSDDDDATKQTMKR